MPATTSKQSRMPFDDKSEDKTKGNGYERPTFVRCDLTADQRKELAEWANAHNADDILDYINQSIEDGYVLSLKPAQSGYQASLTQSRPNAVHVPNGGKSLVTRASAPERALWSLYYKHTQILEKDWSKGNTEAEMDW